MAQMIGRLTEASQHICLRPAGTPAYLYLGCSTLGKFLLSKSLCYSTPSATCAVSSVLLQRALAWGIWSPPLLGLQVNSGNLTKYDMVVIEAILFILDKTLNKINLLIKQRPRPFLFVYC